MRKNFVCSKHLVSNPKIIYWQRENRPRTFPKSAFSFRHYVRSWTRYSDTSGRGMSRWHDIVDWIGGYPFEVAKPEEIFSFYRERGFILEKLKTCGAGIGCNEFVFVKGNV